MRRAKNVASTSSCRPRQGHGDARDDFPSSAIWNIDFNPDTVMVELKKEDQ